MALDGRRSRALVLALCLLLAGCSSTLGGDSEREPTLTPVDVPGDREAGAPVLAPGVSETAVYEPAVLQRTHRQRLADRSFRLYRSATIYPRDGVPARVAPSPVAMRTTTPTAPHASPPTITASPSAATSRPVLDRNGSYNRIVVRSLVADSDERYLVSRIETSSPAYRAAETFARIDIWYSEPLVRNRLVDRRGTSRFWGHNGVQQGGPVSDPTRAAPAVADLAAFDLRLAGERSVGGTTRYRLVGSLRPTRIDTPALVTAPRDGRIEAIISETGIVHRYRLRYEATMDDQPVTVVKTHAIVVDDSGLSRQSWLSEANETVADQFGGGGTVGALDEKTALVSDRHAATEVTTGP